MAAALAVEDAVALDDAESHELLELAVDLARGLPRHAGDAGRRDRLLVAREGPDEREEPSSLSRASANAWTQ
ncbi:MAG TPA: hypothetical protein VF744_14975 [Beijerinckiaceae bacterium]|jgi:hypothetical protein